MAAYGLGALPLGFILYDSSLYLHARFGWNQTLLGKVLWIPPLGWEVGYFVWGMVVDRFGQRFRGLMLAAVLFVLPLAVIHSLGTGTLVLLDMFLAMFGSAGLVVLSLGWVTQAFPRGYSGFLAGAGAGSWGAMVAVTSPWFGRLFDRGGYADAFRIATLISLAGYLIWRAVSSLVRSGVRSGPADRAA
jgi:ACS family hexuronate transporter-like MFS transporter